MAGADQGSTGAHFMSAPRLPAPPAPGDGGRLRLLRARPGDVSRPLLGGRSGWGGRAPFRLPCPWTDDNGGLTGAAAALLWASWVIINGSIAEAKRRNMGAVVLLSIVATPLLGWLYISAVPPLPPDEDDCRNRKGRG